MLWTQLMEPGAGGAGPSPRAAEPTWALYTCRQGPLLSLAGTALESIASHSTQMDVQVSFCSHPGPTGLKDRWRSKERSPSHSDPFLGPTVPWSEGALTPLWAGSVSLL